MEFYSLLNSYGYVVYENKKMEKKFIEIIFRVMKKIADFLLEFSKYLIK